MKKFNAGEWVLLMLAFSVAVSILIGVGGIIFKGSANPTEGAVAVRTALLDLLKVIVGGIFGAIATLKSMKDDNSKGV
jgi:hypothetical protein